MTDRSDCEPPVYYVPGATNHYDYQRDIIILDEELQAYPAAHDYILAHERQHATPDGHTFTGFVRHEFESDLEWYLGSGPVIDEVQEYYRERDPGSLAVATMVKIVVANLLRELWRPVMRAASWLFDTERGDSDTGVDDGDDHLEDVPDGCGCAEIWEHLAAERQDD